MNKLHFNLKRIIFVSYKKGTIPYLLTFNILQMNTFKISLIDTIVYPNTLKVQCIEVRNYNLGSQLNQDDLYKAIAEMRGEEKSWSMWCIKFVDCEISLAGGFDFKDCSFENCNFRYAQNCTFNRCRFKANEWETGNPFKFCVFDFCKFENDNCFAFKMCELSRIHGEDDEISLFQCTLDSKPFSENIEYN